MSKYLFFTDTHFDFSAELNVQFFIDQVRKAEPTGIFITGDISNGNAIARDLGYLAANLDCQIYFNLGNHDYYLSDFNTVRDQINKLCAKYDNLFWMEKEGLISLNEDTILIGSDGWYSADFTGKSVLLSSDWMFNWGLLFLPFEEKIKKFKSMAQESADNLQFKLNLALQTNSSKIIVMTHFPPFKECIKPRLFKNYWYSYEVNRPMGKVLLEAAVSNLNKEIEVLCGHTHKNNNFYPLPNLKIITGKGKFFSAKFESLTIDV